MSESCPNCGSESTPDDVPSYACGSKDYFATPACVLIRSLREELARVRESRNNALANHVEALEQEEFWKGKYRAARDAERDRIADWIDAQGGTMSKIPDNDRCEHDQWSWTGCEMCGLAETAKAIRSNEHHRSNT